MPATIDNTGVATADIVACPKQQGLPRECLTPALIRKFYGFDKLIEQGWTGKGQTIVDIVSFGSPTLAEDMKVFNKAFNLPDLDLEVISPLGGTERDPQNDKSGWASETTLDVQIIHALAPEAKIVVLTSPVAETQGLFGLPEFRQLEQYVLDHKLGSIVSHSWGTSEATFPGSEDRAEIARWDELLRKATTEQGITYFTSSGDQGASEYTDAESTKLATVPTVSFPANSPWVTTVGGTSITNAQSANPNERAWTGSGGGFSTFFGMPDFQKQLPADVQGQFNSKRGLPDVSAVADPYSGLACYMDGSWFSAGGTSASAPLWAALGAIANQMAGKPLGFINPEIYKLATSEKYNDYFRDITAGNNDNQRAGVKGFPAIKGWDAVTGWGVPNAAALVPAIVELKK
jgi:subtilase family serine protease